MLEVVCRKKKCVALRDHFRFRRRKCFTSSAAVIKMEVFLESRAGHWAGGPALGQFYCVPPTAGPFAGAGPTLQGCPLTRTQSPMVTGTSVLGVKFEGGVVIAADMLGSYGSLARFRNISRIMQVNKSTMLGASGDYADFQYLKQVLGQMV